MFLETNAIGAAERPGGETATPVAARQRSGSAPSPYSRVMDEVSGAESGTQAARAKPANSTKPVSLWEHEDFGFADFLDIINPLQHIPIISTIYRNLTGDQIAMAPRVIGGALWGRIGGFVSGVINSVVEWFTGKDIGDHIYSAIWGHGSDAVAQVADTPKLQAESSVNVSEPTANAPAGEAAAAVVVPEAEPKLAADAVHSALTPTEIISSRFLDSYYRRAKESEDASDKPQTFRLSA